VNITLVSTFDLNGGAAQAAHRLHRALRGRGIASQLLVNRRDSDDPDVVRVVPTSAEDTAMWATRYAAIRAEEDVYPVLKAHRFSPFHGERAPSAAQWLDRLQTADVINLHWVRGFVDWEAFFPSQPATRPVVWTLHDLNPFTGGCHYAGGCTGFTDSCGRCPVLGSDAGDDLSAQVLHRKRAVLARSQMPLHLVAPSRWIAKEAQRSSLFAAQPLEVIPNSLDLDRFRPFDREAARAELGLPPGSIIMLFVAHLLDDRRKGLHRLAAALRLLGPVPGLEVVAVGMGTPAFDAPVPLTVRPFQASSACIARFYAAADLVVVPSDQDNLPNTVLEALACGRPVVAFPVGGVPDMICDGETGLLAHGFSDADLSEALVRALQARPRWLALGETARRQVERENAPEVQARRYAALFERVVRDAAG
jgi:glycosyltransferase involved in cell wall biosynthesis